MGKKEIKKKSKSSPRGNGTTGSNSNNSNSGTSSTVSSSATTNTNTSSASNNNNNNNNSEHDNLKVQTYDDLIRSDVDAMMMMHNNTNNNKNDTDTDIDTTTSTSTSTSSSSSSKNSIPKWIGSIDQGTSSTRFMIFNHNGRIIASAQIEHEQIYPQPSWHEHDPIQIWKNTILCMTTVAKAIQNILSITQNEYLFHQYPHPHTSSSSSSSTTTTTATTTTAATTDDETTTPTSTSSTISTMNRFLSAIGITNQRETIVCWNRMTGRPYYNAIVWDDARTGHIVQELQNTILTSNEILYITQTTGLPISTYFAATKMKWLLDHVEQIRYDIQHSNNNVCFGTIDTWLLYQLTGQVPKSEITKRPLKGNAGLCNIGGIYCTDVTNASRWLFMQLSSGQWDPKCIELIFSSGNPTSSYTPYINLQHNLPKICPSSYHYGTINIHCGVPSTMYGNIPITGILGDQQAALFGQAAHTKGCAKNTYGTGLFLMMNTGPTIVPPISTHGLLTTVAYQIGMNGPMYYAYEGSVSHSGSTIQWLRDQIGIIHDASESETLARTTSNNDGLYMVPAFGGLLAPHWRNDARGCIVGITALHHKGHICRAALEATAYQTKDVFDAIIKDSNITLSSLNVDGGGTYNKLLMQFQADILNVKVIRPKIMETTSIGVAFAAGLTIGIWNDVTEIQQLWSIDNVYEPQMSEVTRHKYISGWNKALSKSFNWITPHGILDDELTTTPSTADTKKDTTNPTTTDVGNDITGTSSTLHENDLGSSWMVVPNSHTTSTTSLSSPVADSTEVVTITDQLEESPVDIEEELNHTNTDAVVVGAIVTAVSDATSKANEVIRSNIVEEENIVSTNMTNAATTTDLMDVVSDKEDIVVPTNTKPLLSVSDAVGIDQATNTISTTTSSHNNEKNGGGYDLFTFLSAVGIAFTAGMLVSRKR